jgi:hypothetical protein
MKYLLLTILTFSIGCSSNPQEVLTSENAKADAIKLLSDLKIDYKGIHCGQPNKSVWNNRDYVICDVSSDSEPAKVHCELHDCQLFEKKSFRIKFGLMK